MTLPAITRFRSRNIPASKLIATLAQIYESAPSGA